MNFIFPPQNQDTFKFHFSPTGFEVPFYVLAVRSAVSGPLSLSVGCAMTVVGMDGGPQETACPWEGLHCG